MGAANKIIEGLKQAVKHARCDHDWYFRMSSNPGGDHEPMQRWCRKCECIEHVTEEDKENE